MKKRLSKSFVTVVLVLSMVFGMSFVSNAQTEVVTETFSTGVYNTNMVILINVKKPGSSVVLGKMEIKRETASAVTIFTAVTLCRSVTSYASVTGEGDSYARNTAKNLSSGGSCMAKKSR